MSYNVPDDWGMYYSRCNECGEKTHASEGYACKCDDIVEDNGEPVNQYYRISINAEVILVEEYENGNTEEFYQYMTEDQIKQTLSDELYNEWLKKKASREEFIKEIEAKRAKEYAKLYGR